MEPIISVQNLNKTFGSFLSKVRVTSLREVTFDIYPGEKVCLFGPNGAGKSTIIKTLVGLLKPTSGKVFIKGLNVRQNQIAVKKMISYLPSDLTFFLEVPCKESLYHFALLKGLERRKAKEEVVKILDLLSLSKWGDMPPRLMSSGMKQRFSLALTLIVDPEIILFDELASFLDVKGRMTIYHQVQEYFANKNVTILMSTHNIQEAMILSDRIIVIDRGQIIIDGPIIGVLNTKCKRIEIILSSEKPDLELIRQAIGETLYEISGRKILIDSEDALQQSMNIVNRLNEHKIPVFSFRPILEQQRGELVPEDKEQVEETYDNDKKI